MNTGHAYHTIQRMSTPHHGSSGEGISAKDATIIIIFIALVGAFVIWADRPRKRG